MKVPISDSELLLSGSNLPNFNSLHLYHRIVHRRMQKMTEVNEIIGSINPHYCKCTYILDYEIPKAYLRSALQRRLPVVTMTDLLLDFNCIKSKHLRTRIVAIIGNFEL